MNFMQKCLDRTQSYKPRYRKSYAAATTLNIEVYSSPEKEKDYKISMDFM